MRWLVIRVLIGHYFKYPLHLILALLGLTLGVTLLVTVFSINEHTKITFELGGQHFTDSMPYRIRAKQPALKIPEHFYIQLRQKGFYQCAPFNDIKVVTDKGAVLNLIGIDPIAMANMAAEKHFFQSNLLKLMQKPYPILVSQPLASYMKWKNGQVLTLKNGKSIGPIRVDEHGFLMGNRLIADMALIRQLEHNTELSVIACEPMPNAKYQHLKEILPSNSFLSLDSKPRVNQIGYLYHSNLTALSAFAFLVGLFIFYQAILFSFNQRHTLIGSLKQLGVTTSQLVAALSVELLFFILLSWGLGNMLGLYLANLLIPSISSGLIQLYDVDIGLIVQWSFDAAIYSLLILLVGVVLACIWPFVRLVRAVPVRLVKRLSLIRFSGKEFLIQAVLGICVFACVLFFYQFEHKQEDYFVSILGLLLAAAFITPFVIWIIFDLLSKKVRQFTLRIFFAEAATSMSFRGIATVAFMLALTVNISVETVIGSFHTTTQAWNTEKLAADFYITEQMGSSEGLQSWLSHLPQVASISLRHELDLFIKGHQIKVVGLGGSDLDKKSVLMRRQAPNYWQRMTNGNGILISESMAAKLNVGIGDYIDLQGLLGNQGLIVGVYQNYSDPYNQITMSTLNWKKMFALQGETSLGILLKNAQDKAETQTIIINKAINKFNLNQSSIMTKEEIKEHADHLFDKIFGIANALGDITLIIAVFGIFFATLSGELSRKHYMSLLKAVGVIRAELIFSACLQLILFGLVSILIAVPLGVVIAQLILTIINKSFGWVVELNMMSMEYINSAFIILTALAIAGTLPLIRLAGKSPTKLFRNGF